MSDAFGSPVKEPGSLEISHPLQMGNKGKRIKAGHAELPTSGSLLIGWTQIQF